MAVRLSDDLDPDRSGGDQPSVRLSSSARVSTPLRTAATRSSRQQLAASLRQTAVHDGSSPTTGVPAATTGCSTSSAGAQLPAGAVELAGADPGQPAAGRTLQEARRVPGGGQHLDDRLDATPPAKPSENESTQTTTGRPRPPAARPVAAPACSANGAANGAGRPRPPTAPRGVCPGFPWSG